MPYRIKAQTKKASLEPEELIDRYEHLSDWVIAHLKPILAVTAILVLLGAVWGAMAWWGHRSEEQAAGLQTEAVKMYQSALETGKQQRLLAPETKTSYEQAIAGFQHVRDEYPRTTHAAFALYYIGNAHAALEQYDQAIAAYTTWLKEYQTPELVPLVSLRLAYAYWAKGLPQDALAQFDRILKTSDAPNRDQAYFETGRLLEQQGQKDKALETFNKLATDYPSSPWSSEATPRIVALGGTPPGREPKPSQATQGAGDPAKPAPASPASP